MDDLEIQEYFAVQKVIGDFDQRLLTVKGWGVTLSLAALGAGFQFRSYGLFLVAACSSLAFWALEAVIKRHQMRHYLRMLQIEVARYPSQAATTGRISPLIHWSWVQAAKYYAGDRSSLDDPPVYRQSKANGYSLVWILPHIFLPHLITLVTGIALFMSGCFGWLPNFDLGGK